MVSTVSYSTLPFQHENSQNNAQSNDRDFVSIKLYLLKQGVGQIWLTDYSLLSLAVEADMIQVSRVWGPER